MPKKNQRRIFLKKKKRDLLSSVKFSSKMKKKLYVLENWGADSSLDRAF